MKISFKAIWIIESRLREPLSLEGVAAELGVSAFHLARAFAASHGMPFMRYVRRRRLAVAAQQLRATPDRVLDIALDAGYGSTEAFSRAFRVEFGATPQVFRAQSDSEPSHGLEAIRMEPESTVRLSPPETVALDELRLLGLARRYNAQNSAEIPDQWARFNETCPVPAGQATYGVCYNSDAEGNMDYLCGIEVGAYRDVPDRLHRLTLPAQTYAVFRHGGHVSEIRDVWRAIWNDGLINAGLEASEGPEFEKYGSEFDPVSGTGGFEIWIPIRP